VAQAVLNNRHRAKPVFRPGILLTFPPASLEPTGTDSKKYGMDAWSAKDILSDKKVQMVLERFVKYKR